MMGTIAASGRWGLFKAFQLADGTEASHPLICSVSSSPSTTYFHDGAGALPTINDTVYTTSVGSPFNGASLWYLAIAGVTGLQINSSGVVIDTGDCNV